MAETVIDMQQHFDIDATMDALATERFSMPPVVIAAFRQAAMKGAQKLNEMISSDKFDGLKTQDQLKILEMAFERAYGKSETASSSLQTLHKTGQLSSDNDHGKALDQIEARAKSKDRKFPELAKARVATARPERRPTFAAGAPRDQAPHVDDLPVDAGHEDKIIRREFRGSKGE